MSSPFFFSHPFLYNLIPILPSPTPLYPTIGLKPFLFKVSSPFSTSKPHAAKLFDEIPQRVFSEKNTFTRLSSLRQGKGGENGNLMKYVESGKEMKEEKMGRKGKLDSDEVGVRVRLDKYLKTGDVLGALPLYEEAAEKGLRLHLCSSAERSGSNGGYCGLKGIEGHVSLARKEGMSRTNGLQCESIKGMERSSGGVLVGLSDDTRDNAGRRGVEIYVKMCLEEFPMSEEANSGSVENVFEVEKHMMELGITPEERELEALLRDSVEEGRGEKVYDLLHKLRISVRKVSQSTADAIDAWFRSSTAVRVGKREWDSQAVKQAMENGGGGWHGLGWLGKGKWNVVRTRVDGEGACLCCGEKLVTVDLDPVETERFAECVESIVIKKERNSNFEKFQKWLEYYGPFEAVIDAANVGLFNQRRFSLNKVNAVANGIRQKLPSKKWPLIIIHNKRLSGGKMNEPCNSKLIEKWKNADAIYETPTGSNDDCYKKQMLGCYQ